MSTISEAYRMVMEVITQTNQDKAVKVCKDALKIDPDSKLAYYHLGMIYAGRGLYELAIEHYNEIALRIDPDDPGIWFLASRQYHLNGQLDKALEYYKKTFQLDPLCDKACLYISEIYCDKGENFAQAVQYAHKSLELRTPACMVDEDVFLANRKRAELLLKREGTPKDSVEELDVKTDLANASILKLADYNPNIIPILMKHGIRCIGCAGYEDETLREAALANNSNLEKLLNELDILLSSNE